MVRAILSSPGARTLGDGRDLLSYGENLHDLGAYYESMVAAKAALRALKLHHKEPHRNVASALHAAAHNHLKSGRHLYAAIVFEESVRVRSAAQGEDHPMIGRSLERMAVAFCNLRWHSEALGSCDKARAVFASASGDDSVEVAEVLQVRAEVLYGPGRYAEAAAALRWAEGLVRIAEGDNSPRLVRILPTLWQFDNKAGDFGAAAVADRLSREVRELHGVRQTAEGRWQLLGSSTNVRYSQGELKESLRLFEEALAIARREFGPRHLLTAETLNNTAMVHDSLGNYAEALLLYYECLGIEQNEHGAEHTGVAETMLIIAIVLDKQSIYGEALRLHEECLRLQRAKLGNEHPAVAATLHGIAGALRGMKKYGEALELNGVALRAQRKVLGVGHQAVVATLNKKHQAYSKRQQQKRGSRQPGEIFAGNLRARVVAAQVRLVDPDRCGNVGAGGLRVAHVLVSAADIIQRCVHFGVTVAEHVTPDLKALYFEPERLLVVAQVAVHGGHVACCNQLPTISGCDKPETRRFVTLGFESAERGARPSNLLIAHAQPGPAHLVSFAPAVSAKLWYDQPLKFGTVSFVAQPDARSGVVSSVFHRARRQHGPGACQSDNFLLCWHPDRARPRPRRRRPPRS